MNAVRCNISKHLLVSIGFKSTKLAQQIQIELQI